MLTFWMIKITDIVKYVKVYLIYYQKPQHRDPVTIQKRIVKRHKRLPNLPSPLHHIY
jgi:hypothetical protein